ncbi:bcl2-associated agonist of cell death-like [Carassius auratus]|uniref:Bcl2-associated agonist of cell death-like n=1 Tax=Carassius auratus TaxID=7957 RepID=A0A6P6M1B1_CARAU|nr:bcl2-associated agonist of cell death-like [Carassius auratus]XP_026090530.1 bcl2-associated agonist of cell death-like [Carassius auratus]
MDKTLHDHHQDDSNTLNDKKKGREETINTLGQHQDQTSPNISPRGRVRVYSESQVYTVSRWQEAEPQDGASSEENGGTGDGLPFRSRSQSAPAALWKAKKYGRQLRTMSDEFDTWLDKGEVKRVNSQRQTYRGWFSFLWSPKEEEGRE